MCLERPKKEEEQKSFRRISWNTAPAVDAVNGVVWGEGRRFLFSDSDPSDPISGDRKKEEQKSCDTAPVVGAVNGVARGEGRRLLFSDTEPSDPISGDRKKEEQKTLDTAPAVGVVNGVTSGGCRPDAEPSAPNSGGNFGSKAWKIALGVGAVAGLAVVAVGVGFLLFSGAGPSDPFSRDGEEEGDMKAPGRDYKIWRKDFEADPKNHFKRFRAEKKAQRIFKQ